MSEKINQFCDDLRARLTDVDNRISSLKAGIESAQAKAKAEVQDKLDKARADLDARKSGVDEVHTRIQTALEEKKADTEESIAQWIRDREVGRLERRATIAEGYAADQVLLALVAVEEAEFATLEALAARIDADDAAAAT